MANTLDSMDLKQILAYIITFLTTEREATPSVFPAYFHFGIITLFLLATFRND
jgi:hypothetical protein